ncbi:nicotinate-nucleotide--dimethylbenzimidazole phosphoribosyltransferase [Fusobacterium simiae]|uniref:Nicotinate-nucleotide--dimethylbenzimidazole phosphoribosyltransferase n=1 Tax=Fusobacterium simiae TaxID=855 RepID=A0ABT4DNZ3_FUSSI|nr:nicotinate-nucleotide--dimethylbenzimidazole phosphoribosyltransferase [Fusobacterium simiae]MCY7009091.1 nicotinate-nucleotide--dimethylbenzimidazole phosphoribosyltransferase [Fusobacterium simiae]
MKDKNSLFNLINEIKAVDNESIKRAQIELDRKMKPKNSLGILEDICKKVAGIYGYPLRKLEKKCHIVVASDNGVIEEGVSSCPIEYTPIVSEAMLNNIACIGIFTKTLGVDLNVVDIGMKNDIKRAYPNLIDKKIKRGTNNFYKEKAMSINECLQAIYTGIELINEKVKDYDIFSNGEMGIANTTTSSALLYSVTKKNIDDIVGRGGGLSDEGLNKKKKIIVEACERYNTFGMDAVDMLASVGGFDLACMVGMYIGIALNKKLMLVDGFISSIAALLACSLNKNIQDYLLFTHKSEEPGVNIILDYLKEKTFLNMNMRLGEGTGAVLAYPIIDCAIEMINTMKSPEEVYDLFYK